MRTLTLMFHDVLDDAAAHSGFQGPGAARYKIDAHTFGRHLDAVSAARADAPADVVDVLGERPQHDVWMLSFDDGGTSAMATGDVLATRGWRGHFFVTAGAIGSPGFLTEQAIRELHAQGHRIGSHSYNHPARMSAAPQQRLLDEWRASVERLSEIVDAPVTVASVPGGYVSRRVIRAAAAAGITALFTSAPLLAVRERDGCLVFGRYTVRRRTPPETVGAVAAGRRAPRLRQAAAWQALRVVKAAAGPAYPAARRAILNRF